MKQKVFIYKPLELLLEGERGFVSSAAILLLYQNGTYGYCINLLASYSLKQDDASPIAIIKKDGQYLVENFISANVIFYPYLCVPEGLKLTDFVEVEPIFYRSPQYVNESSFALLRMEFFEMIDYPELITKDPDYFSLLVKALKQNEKIDAFYRDRSLLDTIEAYYHFQSEIEQIDKEIKDPWVIAERDVYTAWIDTLYSHITSRINAEWGTLSKERQQEFHQMFDSSGCFEWLVQVPKH